MQASLVAALAAVALAATAGATPRVAARGSHELGWDHYRPRWSPDGSRILFERAYDPPKAGGDYRLVLMRSDGSGRRALARPPSELEQWDFGGDWSPDGRTVVFSRQVGLDEEHVGVAHVSDGTVRILTDDPSFEDTSPAWSPDGRLIAFTRRRGSKASVAVMRPDGGLRTVASGSGPFWSPDGTTLAFASQTAAGRGTAVSIVRLDGTGLRKLTDDGWNFPDDWSPDGRILVFERDTDTDEPSLWTMRADGSEKRKLADGYDARFSPDGRSIVFHRRSEGRDLVLVMPSAGGAGRVVFRGGRGATWSPSGKLLAVSASRPCIGSGIYVLRADGRGAHRLTNDCRIVGTAGADALAGTAERDVIRGLAGHDVIRANPGALGPVYYGRGDRDFVDGGAGNDRIWGGRSTDVLRGGLGNDELHGGRGVDRLYGGRGDDVLDGGRYYDRLFGGSGDDLVLARDGFPRDRIFCGPGRDRVVADRGDVLAADCESVITASSSP